jgi:acylphosphatase
MRKRVRIKVKGVVQGVAFRAYTRKEARRFGLTGFVRNLPDRSVEIEAEGEREQLEALVKWAWQGSPAAVVTDVITFWSEPSGGCNGFEVRFD